MDGVDGAVLIEGCTVSADTRGSRSGHCEVSTS